MNRRLIILSIYLVAGVMMSAYGASQLLAGVPQVIAQIQHAHGTSDIA